MLGGQASRFRALRPVSPFGIRSEGWLPAQNEVPLCAGSNLDHDVSLALASDYVNWRGLGQSGLTKIDRNSESSQWWFVQRHIIISIPWLKTLRVHCLLSQHSLPQLLVIGSLSYKHFTIWLLTRNFVCAKLTASIFHVYLLSGDFFFARLWATGEDRRNGRIWRFRMILREYRRIIEDLIPRQRSTVSQFFLFFGFYAGSCLLVKVFKQYWAVRNERTQEHYEGRDLNLGRRDIGLPFYLTSNDR